MQVYAPMWFSIKKMPYVQDGARLLCKTLQAVKQFDSKIKYIVLPVINRNGYFAHPENILLAMVGDERPHIRELGWRRIKRARCDSSESNKDIRKFQIPKINSNCEDYVNLINWADVIISEPPITRGLSDEDIERNIVSKEHFSSVKFPLHTQAVEI